LKILKKNVPVWTSAVLVERPGLILCMPENLFDEDRTAKSVGHIVGFDAGIKLASDSSPECS